MDKEKLKKVFEEEYFAYWGFLASLVLIIALFIPQIGYQGRSGESFSSSNVSFNSPNVINRGLLFNQI